MRRVAHRGQIDHGRNAGEILHQYARRAVGDFGIAFAGLEPCADGLDIVDRDRAPVFKAQQIFEQNLKAEGQAGQIAERFFGRLEAEIIVGFAADGKRGAGF